MLKCFSVCLSPCLCRVTDQQVEVDPERPVKMLQARAMVQHCTQARVKVKPAVDGAEAQWTEVYNQ